MARLLTGLIALIIPVVVIYATEAQELTPTQPTPSSPTSTATATPAPTRTPRANEGTLVVHIVNDLNENGVRDPGEPGLEGWYAFRGCSDDLIGIGLTDASGRLVRSVRSGLVCILVEEQFGWFYTSEGLQRGEVEPGTTVELVFLFRHVGDNPQRISGSVIVKED